MKFSELQKLATERGINLWRDEHGVVYQTMPSGYAKKLGWLRTYENVARHLNLLPEVDIGAEANRIANEFAGGAKKVDGYCVAYDTVSYIMYERGLMTGKQTLETCNKVGSGSLSRCTYIITVSDWITG